MSPYLQRSGLFGSAQEVKLYPSSQAATAVVPLHSMDPAVMLSSILPVASRTTVAAGDTQ